MACQCLVSMTLSIPVSASHFTKELPPRKSALVRLASQPTSGKASSFPMGCSNRSPVCRVETSTQVCSIFRKLGSLQAAKPSASCNTNEGISSLNRSCQRHLLRPSKTIFEIMCCRMNVHSCSHIIIYGYWVGPDIDDGWGYVEAFVNPIT